MSAEFVTSQQATQVAIDEISRLRSDLSSARAECERYRSALEWVSQITEDGYCDNLYSIETIAGTARATLEAK